MQSNRQMLDGSLLVSTRFGGSLLARMLASDWWLAAFIFVFTRAFALAGAYVGASRLVREQPAYGKGWFAEMSLMWDSAYYATIAQGGYSFDPAAPAGANVAFPPLYPFFINLLSGLLRAATFSWNWGNNQYGSTIAAGLIISNVAFVVALALLVRWLSPRFGRVGAALVALGLASLPTAFFFSAIYTESLFLMLVLACFCVAHSDMRLKWLLVGLLGMLASLTRFTGVLLLPVFLLDYLAQVGWKPRRVRTDILWLGLVPAGVALYIGFLWWRFGDPSAMNSSMLQGWNHKLSFFVETYWNSAAQLWNSVTGAVPAAEDPVLHYGNGSRLYLVLDLALPLVLLVGAFLARKKLLVAEWAWLVLGIVYPLSTNITFSMARYVLPLWPGLLALGLLRGRYRWVGVALIVASLALMSWSASKYASARWIG